MAPTLAERNKQLALNAFDTLFNRRNYEAAATMWSEGYIQHSTEIAPGRDGLFERARSFPPTESRYSPTPARCCRHSAAPNMKWARRPKSVECC